MIKLRLSSEYERLSKDKQIKLWLKKCEKLIKDELNKRFKLCPQCNNYFFDQTKNSQKQRCSKHCTNLFWSRDRRKRVGHKT